MNNHLKMMPMVVAIDEAPSQRPIELHSKHKWIKAWTLWWNHDVDTDANSSIQSYNSAARDEQESNEKIAQRKNDSFDAGKTARFKSKKKRKMERELDWSQFYSSRACSIKPTLPNGIGILKLHFAFLSFSFSPTEHRQIQFRMEIYCSIVRGKCITFDFKRVKSTCCAIFNNLFHDVYTYLICTFVSAFAFAFTIFSHLAVRVFFFEHAAKRKIATEKHNV